MILQIDKVSQTAYLDDNYWNEIHLKVLPVLFAAQYSFLGKTTVVETKENPQSNLQHCFTLL